MAPMYVGPMLGAPAYGAPMRVYIADIELKDLKSETTVPLWALPAGATIYAVKCELVKGVNETASVKMKVGTYNINEAGLIDEAIAEESLFAELTLDVKSNPAVGTIYAPVTQSLQLQKDEVIAAAPTVTTAATEGTVRITVYVAP